VMCASCNRGIVTRLSSSSVDGLAVVASYGCCFSAAATLLMRSLNHLAEEET
jgi:hypothetical protein